MSGSYDVQFWDITKRTDGRSKPYRARWKVGTEEFEDSFRTKTLAKHFVSRLTSAAQRGEAFDEETGLPASQVKKPDVPSWYDHATAYAAMKWPRSAAKARRTMADALATLTGALVEDAPHRPSAATTRTALYGWTFNPSRSVEDAPTDILAALTWIQAHSLLVTDLDKPDTVRLALNACSRTLTGSAAATTTFRRKRAVLSNALGYAVERELLGANPLSKVQWKADEVAKAVDRRVVVNPRQAAALLAAVARQGRYRGPHLVAFFGCLYYGGLRPGEALALRIDHCHLPATGWGRLDLEVSEPLAGADWTDSGAARETQQLKHRGENEIRPVPIPPELVALLVAHVKRFGVGRHGRLFRSENGEPVQDTSYGSVWHKARRAALTEAQVASPLARRPYDLRHAAISLWLNAGVPATEVARRAGHGVAVMLQVYANCIDGEAHVYNERIAALLSGVGHAGTTSGGHATLGTASDPSEAGATGVSRADHPTEGGQS